MLNRCKIVTKSSKIDTESLHVSRIVKNRRKIVEYCRKLVKIVVELLKNRCFLHAMTCNESASWMHRRSSLFCNETTPYLTYRLLLAWVMVDFVCTVKPPKPVTHGECESGRFTEGGRFRIQWKNVKKVCCIVRIKFVRPLHKHCT